MMNQGLVTSKNVLVSFMRWILSPQNLYVQVLISVFQNITLFGNGVVADVIILDEVTMEYNGSLI